MNNTKSLQSVHIPNFSICISDSPIFAPPPPHPHCQAALYLLLGHSELGTFGIFYFLNTKKLFLALII